MQRGSEYINASHQRVGSSHWDENIVDKRGLARDFGSWYLPNKDLEIRKFLVKIFRDKAVAIVLLDCRTYQYPDSEVSQRSTPLHQDVLVTTSSESFSFSRQMRWWAQRQTVRVWEPSRCIWALHVSVYDATGGQTVTWTAWGSELSKAVQCHCLVHVIWFGALIHSGALKACRSLCISAAEKRSKTMDLWCK